MLDNIRRKFSNPSTKDFYDIYLECGKFDDLIYYESIICSISAERGMKKTSKRSFKNFHKSSKNLSLNGIHMKMILCPSGTFTMGHYSEDDNKPRPEVIERPFLLGETEVTQELYQAVMGTNLSSFDTDPQNPVEQVSWVDAILFCNELSRLQGLELCYTKNSESLDYGWDFNLGKNGYRLPTEKEWEYAAKAGTQNQWAGTDEIFEVSKYAVYLISSTRICSVKSKLPNEWGFYDMSGNVREWCWDKYDPKENALARRVVRGGGWAEQGEAGLRIANRGKYSPSDRHSFAGLRVCRTLV